MTRRMALFVMSAAIMLGMLGGCSYEEHVERSDYDYGSRKPGDWKATGVRAYGITSNSREQHNNAFFEYSSILSRKVTSLNGVATALVMLTDKNAYVGILLDWTAVGTTGQGGTEEQNNTGTNGGVYNADTGSPYGNGKALVTPYNSYFSVNDHHNLSSELKQTIANAVRDEAPMIQEVHISANMELVNYFNEFAKEAWGGRPLSPWLDRFNQVVQYHFAGGNDMPPPITQPGEVSPQEWQLQLPR